MDAEVVQTNPGTQEDWRRALERVVPCVCVLKVTQTRSCDTEPASSSYATGFIVDKVRGLILTNRHVHTPGPIVAEAIFLNREEAPVVPVYYDPVHDFAFLRFDPSKLQFMAVDEVPLAPEGAAVGLDIRVVGNDSGEKVSILAGTLARLDRDAPCYGRRGYNDFNTFYLQAASGTKGGSSGSPVIDCYGRAVGLNAGGKNKAASAYYLPLERVVRALALIRAANPLPLLGGAPQSWVAPRVARGDLQTTFVFKGFDEVRRLGLRQDTEAAVRAAPGCSHGAPPASGGASGPGTYPATVGMLVVESVVPGSPADGVLEPGDVLVRLDGKVVSHFLPLEQALDDAVGGEVLLSLERGGVPFEARLAVTDLHTVTPAALLEVAGGSVHALSYQQARNNRAAVGQVYVAEPGYVLGRAGVPKHAIITRLAGCPTPDVAAFATALRALLHRARVPLEYYTFHERHRRKNAILQVDRQWYGPALYWQRDDAAGAWHPTAEYPPDYDAAAAAVAVAAFQPGAHAAPVPTNGTVSAAPAPTTPLVMDAPAVAPATSGSSGAASEGSLPVPLSVLGSGSGAAPHGVAGAHYSTAVAEDAAAGPLSQDAYEERLRRCLCLVDADIPLVALSDGVHSRAFAGNGVVVHHSPTVGIVLVDRNTVAIGPCDVNLSFGAHPAEVPATVRMLHPLHNFALVSYSPSDLPQEARDMVAAAQLDDTPLRRGDSVRLVGLTKSLRTMQRSSVVTNACAALTIPTAEVPRFRAVHEEVVKLDQDFGSTFSGVLTDARGAVRALWGSYAEQVDKEEREWCAGLATRVFAPWVKRLVASLDGPGGPARALPPPTVRVLDAELEAVLLSKAAQFGLPAEWVSRLDQLDPERRQVLRVRSTVAQSSASAALQSGDMLLAMDGEPVTNFTDVERRIALASASASAVPWLPPSEAAATLTGSPNSDSAPRPAKRRKSDVASPAAQPAAGVAPADTPVPSTPSGVVTAPATPVVELTLYRNGSISTQCVALGVEDGMGTDRLVHWCGAQLQAPHRAVRELGYLPPGGAGVYVSRWHHGSPAHRYGLYALHWVTHVNGVPTPDLDALVAAVAGLVHGAFARVRVVHLETTQAKVLTLKVDLQYWPTWQLRLDPLTCEWKRVEIVTPSKL